MDLASCSSGAEAGTLETVGEVLAMAVGSCLVGALNDGAGA